MWTYVCRYMQPKYSRMRCNNHQSHGASPAGGEIGNTGNAALMSSHTEHPPYKTHKPRKTIGLNPIQTTHDIKHTN